MVHRRVRGGKYKINYAGKPVPINVGNELEVNIIGTAPSGDGISKIRGYVIVVPKAKPRDHLTIRVTEVNEKVCTGKIIE